MAESVFSIRFALLADFHYKKGMYIPSVKDLQTILDRARESGAELVIHVGDFCNDYLHSPELTNAYRNNSHGLPVYGIYGNHELETQGNCMEIVTPMLTNREVVWGTPNEKIGNGSIAYYFFDKGNFRFVCLDTNYSIDPATGEYVHNPSPSHGPPAGNSFGNSVGPVQLAWLEKVLFDAAQTRKICLVFSHFAFADGLWWSPPLAEEVRAIFEKVNAVRRGTVRMAINGHLHTNRVAERNGIVYFDVNTVRNTLWVNNSRAYDHYGDKTYLFTDYDADGKEIARHERPIHEMRMAKNTWFNTDPLSAIVTVRENGKIEIEGSESTWLYGIAPTKELCGTGVEPRIASASFDPDIH